jgi:hypothetical protein
MDNAAPLASNQPLGDVAGDSGTGGMCLMLTWGVDKDLACLSTQTTKLAVITARQATLTLALRTDG